MPSASMNRLMDNARVNLPGALDSAIQAELFAVMAEFTQRVNLWTQEFDLEVEPVTASFNDDPDAYTYRVSPPTGARVHRLIYVVDAGGKPVYGAIKQPNYVMIAQSPNEAQIYKAKVTLTVTDPVTRAGEPVVPDWIVDNHNTLLLAGVLSRMMAQAAKPYSSTTLALHHGRVFMSLMSTARIEADRNNVYRAQNWRFPQGFATVRRQ